MAFVDLEKLIHKAAWDTIQMPKNWCGFERPCKRIGRKLVIHWNAIQESTTAELTEHNEPNTKTVTLFETQFNNESTEDQTFEFQVQKYTESTMEISVQSGVTIGKNMKCSFSIKPPALSIDLTGVLGKEIKLEKQVTDKYNRGDKLMWGVNAPVKVPGGKRATVSLQVDEVEVEGDLVITTDIKTKDKTLPVYAVSKKDDKVVACANVGVKSITKLNPLSLSEDSDYSFHYESHAKLKVKHCIGQKVCVKFENISKPSQPGRH